MKIIDLFLILENNIFCNLLDLIMKDKLFSNLFFFCKVLLNILITGFIGFGKSFIINVLFDMMVV